MSQFAIALIASASVLSVILATDLGHRKVTRMRILRSVLAVGVIIALFVRSLPTVGNSLTLQLAGVGLGVVFGLLVAVFLPTERAGNGEIYTRAGLAYAVAWTVLSAGRVVFAFGAEHWFAEELITFSIKHQIAGADAYANAFVFLSLAMVLTRSAVLLGKARKLRAAAPATVQAETTSVPVA
ncbi:hypothetical protein FB561_1831 [Kribbella amoyensis]|uniref:Uncharacterized protein n=1 Tax=Kribbella amoyensis TaxID=996641 RepID=A0A561BPK9_9ACTN|nr:hypothetical protein [Kribbella amoyensis]TWD80743.1 hypothetical protein FB561_1831 [Kribbella amoyensis]